MEIGAGVRVEVGLGVGLGARLKVKVEVRGVGLERFYDLGVLDSYTLSHATVIMQMSLNMIMNTSCDIYVYRVIHR